MHFFRRGQGRRFGSGGRSAAGPPLQERFACWPRRRRPLASGPDRGRRLASVVLHVLVEPVLLADGPDEADQLAGDRHLDLLDAYASPGQRPVALVQAVLGLRGDVEDLLLHADLPVGQLLADLRGRK